MRATDIKVIYEDNHIIVVQKPVNIPSQGDESGDIDMLSLVKEYIKEKYNKPGNVFLVLVQRLDRPVGGVMVFARTSKAAGRLSEQVRTREIKKTYIAVLSGVPEKREGILEHYILKDEKTNTVKVFDSAQRDSKFASLDYKVLGNSEDGLCLVSINLHTGRPHQIRAQFSHIGCSVVGDMKYGKEDEKKGNIALWSYTLQLQHPTTKELLSFSCLPPKTGTWKVFEKEIDNVKNSDEVIHV